MPLLSVYIYIYIYIYIWLTNLPTFSLWLQDRYAFNRTIPSYDASQDWELTGANEEGEFTTLQFERKLETCDPDDRAINFVSYSYQH